MSRFISKVALLTAIFALQSVCAAEPSQDTAPELRSGAYVPITQQRDGIEVRGFAKESGGVVLPANGKLGELLADLSWLGTTPKVSALGLAERVAWLLGSNYRLVRRSLDLPRSLGVVATIPRRVYEPDGSLRLHFLLKRASSPATVELYAATLDCSPQYQAQLSLQRIR